MSNIKGNPKWDWELLDKELISEYNKGTKFLMNF